MVRGDGGGPPQSHTSRGSFCRQDHSEWRCNWPYPVIDGCSVFVTHRWQDAQCEVDCAVYYTPVSGGSVTEMLQLGEKNDPIEKSTRFSLIARYISVNMTEILITPN